MTSPFCKTYLAAQGVQILDAPKLQETHVVTERVRPIAPVIVPGYEQGF